MSFLENRHPEWKNKNKKWEFSWKNYTGDYASHDRVDLFRKRKGTIIESDPYLHRKVQAETDSAYLERIATSDPIMLFPTAVDSLNGMMYSNQESNERDFGDLGDPEDEESIAWRLWHNIDGSGTNWIPHMKKVGIKQTVLHTVWGLVDGIKEQTFEDEEGNVVSEVVGDATIHVIDPQSVVDWFPNNDPTQVLVKEQTDMRASIQDDPELQDADTYILYELGGWTRFRDNEGSPEVIGQGEYQFYADKRRERQALPIFKVDMPMPRMVGYITAIKQNHIYNAKSIRDFSVRNMSFAFLRLVATQDQYQEMLEGLKNGFRVLRQDPEAKGSHGYESPPSDYLSEAGDILEKDKQEFMESVFKQYGDSAKQVTATEIMQESRSGIEAFLNLLVTSVDEFENNCLFLLEQVYFPEEPTRWGNAYVKRAKDFSPKDVKKMMEEASATVRNASQAGAMSKYRMVEILNPEYTEEEIEAEVQRIREESGAVEVPDNLVGG